MNSPATAAMKSVSAGPATGAARLVGRRPGEPRRVEPQGTTRTQRAIRLQHRRRQRVERQHGLGLLERPAQLLVIFRRADPGQRPLAWCSAPE